MNRYTHLGLHDEAAALDKLPQLPGGPTTEPAALKATGTNCDRPSPHAGPHAGRHAGATDNPCVRLRAAESGTATDGGKAVDASAAVLGSSESGCEGLSGEEGRGPSRIRTGDGGFARRGLPFPQPVWWLIVRSYLVLIQGVTLTIPCRTFADFRLRSKDKRYILVNSQIKDLARRNAWLTARNRSVPAPRRGWCPRGSAVGFIGTVTAASRRRAAVGLGEAPSGFPSLLA
jgi:hypothetical protein